MNVRVEIPSDKADKSFFKKYNSYQLSRASKKPDVGYDSLSSNQKKIIDDFKNHISRSREEILADGKLVILNGPAGSGKSVVGKLIKKLLLERKQEKDFDFLITAYSGVAASVLQGQTLHSALKIPAYVTPITMQYLLNKKINKKVQQELAKVVVILVDEYSLLGLRFFSYVDKFFRKIDPSRSDVPFSGRSVCLLGDIAQLPPTRDYTLWSTDFNYAPDKELLVEASAVFRQFKIVYKLEQVYRQNGEQARQFRELLGRLRLGKTTSEDVALLRTRMQCNLTELEINCFKDALHIFQRVAQVEEHNM